MSPKKILQPLDLYIRVSDTRGRSGESFISPQEQEDRCRAAVASRGLKVGEVFHEMDVSGGSMERPELRKVRERIEAGVSGGIVVAKIDRFGRTVVGALQAMQEIDEAGGVVITAEGDFDTSTPVGELVLGMMLQLAQFELRRIRENWTSAKRSAVDRCIHVSKHVPPGYRREERVKGRSEKTGNNLLKIGPLVPHPKHAATVRKGFEMAASGVGSAAIAEYFTRRELPSGDTLKPTWRSNRIGRLLANRVYLGEARGSGEIVNPDAHEPLVDKVTWRKAQRKAAATPIKSESKYLLSGLVRCASCRGALRGQVPSKHAKATYRCAGQKVAGPCPHPSSITMERLDEIVYDAYVKRMFSRRETREPSTRDDSAALAALEDARKAVAEVEAMHGRGELGPVAYGKALEAALADEEAVEKELTSRQARFDFGAAAQRAARQALVDLERVKSGESIIEIMRENPAGWDLTRQMLATEIQTIFVRPPVRRSKSIPVADRVKIIWRDDAEEMELPVRGSSHVFEPYIWAAA